MRALTMDEVGIVANFNEIADTELERIFGGTETQCVAGFTFVGAIVGAASGASWSYGFGVGLGFSYGSMLGGMAGGMVCGFFYS